MKFTRCGKRSCSLLTRWHGTQLRKIGNYKFISRSCPSSMGIEVVVDPKVIDGWAFSGWDGGDIGHTWLITACKQEKPCVK